MKLILGFDPSDEINKSTLLQCLDCGRVIPLLDSYAEQWHVCSYSRWVKSDVIMGEVVKEIEN